MSDGVESSSVGRVFVRLCAVRNLSLSSDSLLSTPDGLRRR